MTEGYQIIALGQEKYSVMAEGCAISIRRVDPKRKIQIVTDNVDRFKNTDIFDVVTPCKHDASLKGPIIKLKAHEYRVFDRTMFVDCDCIMFRNIDEYWGECSEFDFSVVGEKRISGSWYGASVADLCVRFNIPYIVAMNSGVIYMADGCEKILDYAWGIYESQGNFLNHNHRGNGAPDEPYLGIALGAFGREPLQPVAENGKALMLSTINGFNFNFDISGGVAEYTKGDKQVSPAIVHFVGAKPRDKYQSLINEMRALHDLPAVLI